MNYQETVMGIIMNGGNARSKAMESLQLAKQKDIDGARQKIKQCGEDLAKAHRIQTDLIQAEARGESQDATLLMIHAQDHLMNAMTVKDLANEMIDLYERIEIK